MKIFFLKLKLFFLLAVTIFFKKLNRSDNKNFQVTALEDGKNTGYQEVLQWTQ
jgi:hypothetical protein